MLANTLPGTLDEFVRGFGRRLAARQPALERALLYARDYYARRYVAARVAVAELRHDAPLDPYRLVSVDPADVEYVAEFDQPKFRNAGRVVGGDWDRPDYRFEDLDVYRAYEHHFRDGMPWRETEFFDRVVGQLEAGQEQWGCTTRTEFERRCRKLDSLYDAIAEDGYRTQAELRESDAVDPIKDPHALKTERYKNEIAVHVGRDGELLFEDGRNRLSIVKLLDLDEVPVRILRRHADWQAVRDAYVRGDAAVRDRGDHPDLAALEFGGGGAGP